MKNFFPIFKAGQHTDSKGKVLDFSEEDVKSLVDNYDPDWLSAPFSTDHKKDGPAFGYAKTLKYENGTVYACFDDMSDNLRDAVKKDHFGRVSIELFNQPEKGRYLKAISLLGVKTPSIKGMEGELRQKSQFSQQAAEAVIAFQADFNEETEEYSLGDVVTDPLETEEPEKKNEPAGDDTKFAEMESRIAKLEEEKQNLENKFQQTDQERKQAQERLTEIEIDQQRLRFEQYLEEKIAYGSVMPRQKDKIMELLTALDSVQKFMENNSVTEFEEGSPETKLVSLFQELINDLPKIVDGEEQVRKGEEQLDFEDPVAISKEITAFMQAQKEKGITVSYTEALNHVKSQNN